MKRLQLTGFFGFVENTQTVRALPLALDDLHAEFVFRVGLQIFDVNIEVGGIYEFLLPLGPRRVFDRVVSVVHDSLVATQRRVGPRQDNGGRRQNDGFSNRREVLLESKARLLIEQTKK